MARPTSRNKQTPYHKRRCHRCHGSGNAPCPICGGAGKLAKGKDRFGAPIFDRCEGCFGTKTRRCSVCNGEGLA